MVDTLSEIIRGALNGDAQSLSLIAAVYIFLVCS